MKSQITMAELGGSKSSHAEKIASFSGTHITTDFEPTEFLIYCPIYNTSHRSSFYFNKATDPNNVYQNFDGTESTRSVSTGGIYPDSTGITIENSLGQYFTGKLVYVVAGKE